MHIVVQPIQNILRRSLASAALSPRSGLASGTPTNPSTCDRVLPVYSLQVVYEKNVITIIMITIIIIITIIIMNVRSDA